MADPHNKLFHVLVVVGVGLTGTGLSSCTGSSTVDSDAADDALHDGSDVTVYADITAPDRYVGISIDTGPPRDAIDAPIYADISVDTGPLDDATDAPFYDHISADTGGGGDDATDAPAYPDIAVDSNGSG